MDDLVSLIRFQLNIRVDKPKKKQNVVWNWIEFAIIFKWNLDISKYCLNPAFNVLNIIKL